MKTFITQNISSTSDVRIVLLVKYIPDILWRDMRYVAFDSYIASPLVTKHISRRNVRQHVSVTLTWCAKGNNDGILLFLWFVT